MRREMVGDDVRTGVFAVVAATWSLGTGCQQAAGGSCLADDPRVHGGDQAPASRAVG